MTTTPLIFFDDSVTAAVLPANKYGVYYVDGIYANYTAVRRRLPNAALFGITVHGLTGKGIFACDSETGDLTVTQTETWVVKQHLLGVELICVYANLNRWLNEGLLKAIQAIEAKYGIKIKKWVADYNDVKNVLPWADAHQFLSTNVPNLDYDVALANFFKGVTPVATPAAVKPKPKPVPPRPAQTRVPDPNVNAPVKLPKRQVSWIWPFGWFDQQLRIALAQLKAQAKKLSTGKKS